MTESVEDRVRGVLYGQAVGDALGLGTEFLSRDQVARRYPDGLLEYSQIVPDAHRVRWAAGDWTDDTDQMLCILDSLVAEKAVAVRDIARRLQAWAFGGGMGIGQTVYNVLYSPSFLDDPHGTARWVWEAGQRRAAANGAVMRTSVLGLWERHDPERVNRNAEAVARITHYDPRCVASCVAVCRTIAALVDGTAVQEAVRVGAEAGAAYQPGLVEWLAETVTQPLAALDLDEGLNPGEPDRIGYTMKALGAGYWALVHAPSFEEGVLQVVHEGGDADTNASVAGALLGARWGFGAIPERWITGLAYEGELRERVEQFLKLL